MVWSSASGRSGRKKERLTVIRPAVRYLSVRILHCLDESVYCNCRESKEYDCRENVADDLESLLPKLVAPADGLECAPEAMGKMEPQGSEPDYVKHYHPPVSESGGEKEIRVGSFLSHEFLELHLVPEMGQMEGDETEHDDSEHQHVLGCPAFSPGLACLSALCAVLGSPTLCLGPSAQRSPTLHGLTALRGLACWTWLATKQKAKLELRSGLALWS